MKNKLLFFLMGVILFCSLASKANAATYTVTNCATSGYGSLKDAVEFANLPTNEGTVILFNIPTTEAGYTTEAGASFWRIRTSGDVSHLLSLTGRGTIISGESQAAYIGGDPNPYGPEIELRGYGSGTAGNAIDIATAECAIKGLVINNFGNGYYGINIGGDSNRIYGCYIGTNAPGASAAANFIGIRIQNGCSNNIIGSTESTYFNVISGNSDDGIYIFYSADSNQIIGNYIGTNKDGSAALGNGGRGVHIYDSASFNKIGNGNSNGKNIISGNYVGVDIEGSGNFPSSNEVLGNYIGTDANGTAALGNSTIGINLHGGAQYTKIGNGTAGGRNIISGNLDKGIYITGSGTNNNEVIGNYIGTAADGIGDFGDQQDYGVEIYSGASYNIIGGVTSAARNVIAGNSYAGIYIHGVGTDGNKIKANYIGLRANGTGLANGYYFYGGVYIESGNYNIIGGITEGERNIISSNEAAGGITLSGANSNEVLGNYIGTNANGTAALANTPYGIKIRDGATNNKIGSIESGGRNIISGNGGSGIYLSDTNTDNNQILGNYIGTDVNGTASLGNSFGIYLNNGPKFNEIGGAVAGQGNVISGNTYGIMMYETGTDSNEVLGNFIGTDANGTASLGNSQIGVLITGGIGAGGRYNKIGDGTQAGRNIISSNYIGVQLQDANRNKVLGNYVGTDVNGTASLGNSGKGVYIFYSSDSNLIGDGTSGGRNIISGNYIGVDLAGSGAVVPTNNAILGNYIGTDKNGTAALGNSGSGVYLEYAAQYNKIGGVAAGEGNLISGNGAYGIYITGSGTDSNEAAGNQIGTRIDGISGLSNSSGGIEIADTARFNQVGPLNIIAYNGGPGVSVGGFGTDFNRIAQNSMFENSGLGIELLNSSNVGIAAPAIITALNDLATGEAVPNATIELFSTGNPDPMGSGEGRTYLGSTTEASGSWLIALALTGGTTITATATDSNNNTSMFSWNNIVSPTTTTTTSTVPGTTTTTTTTTTTIKYPTMVILTAEATLNAIDVSWEASQDPAGIDFYILFRGRKSSAEVEVIDNFDSASFDTAKWGNWIEIGSSFEAKQSGGKLNIKQIGSLVGDKDKISVAGYYTTVSYEAKPRFIKISADVDIRNSSVSHNGKHDYLLAGPIVNAGSFDAFAFTWLGKSSDITLPGYLFGGENQDPMGVGTTSVPDSGKISGIIAGDGLSLFLDNKYLGLFINKKGSDLPHYYGFMTLVATTAAYTDVDFDNFYAGEYPVEMVASIDASDAPIISYHDTDVIVGETYFYAVSPNSPSGKSGSNVAEAQLTATTTTTTSTSTISTTTTTLPSGLSGFSKVSPVLRPGAALNIDFLAKETGSYTMFIFYQSTGVMVNDIPFTPKPGKNRVSWEPSGSPKVLRINTGEEAPPGIYYYEIRSSNGALVTWGNLVVVKTL